jgi:hypothetical protein
MSGTPNNEVGGKVRLAAVYTSLLLLSVIVHPSWGATPATATTAVDQTQDGASAPRILRAWIGYKLPDDWTGPPYPFDNTNIEVRLFIEAKYRGTTMLFSNPASIPAGDACAELSTVGADGPHVTNTTAGFTSFPSIESTASYSGYYDWNTSAAAEEPVVEWYQLNESCTRYWTEPNPADISKTIGYRTYAYTKSLLTVDSPWVKVGTWSAGLHRLVAKVTFKGNICYTPSREFATRICVRNSDTFSLDVTKPAEKQRSDYLQWLYAYVGEPYEFGGYWFGGIGEVPIKNIRQGSYTGHGIDCSGLVSNGAKWAGYNWSGGPEIVPWRMTTNPLFYCSNAVTKKTFPTTDPFGQGDILVYYNKKEGSGHVVSITDIGTDGDTIEIVESIGQSHTGAPASGESIVHTVGGKSIVADYRIYEKRRLVDH